MSRPPLLGSAPRASALLLVLLLVLLATACENDSAGSPVDPGAPAPVAHVVISPSTFSMDVGATRTLQVVLKDADDQELTGRTVTWSSTRAEIASVAGTGTVTGHRVGTTTLTAFSEGRSGSAVVTVQEPAPPPPAPVHTVLVSPENPFVPVGETLPLQATLLDADGNELQDRDVLWSSQNNGVATVDGAGVVSGVGPGMAPIRVDVEGKVGFSMVEVGHWPPVASVVVMPDFIQVDVGTDIPFEVALLDDQGNLLEGRTVTWASEAPGILELTAEGRARAVAPGRTRIWAHSEGRDGFGVVEVVPPLTSPTLAFTLAGLYPDSPLGTVGTGPWTDDQGLEHQAWFVVRTAELVLDWTYAHYPTYRLDVTVAVHLEPSLQVPAVAEEVLEDRGLVEVLWNGAGYRLLSTTTPGKVHLTSTNTAGEVGFSATLPPLPPLRFWFGAE